MHRPRARRPPSLAPARLRAGLWLAVVAAAYVGAGKLGLELSVSHGVITPVWAPSGLALAALVILGVRFWPAVAVGALVVNATSDASLAVAAGIAVGNTLEAVVGTLLLRRLGFRAGLDRVRDVIVLTVCGALLSTAVAATNGVTVLTLAGERQDAYGTAWLLWWFGDAVGDLMVAPLLFVLYACRHWRPSKAQLVEGLALVGAVAGVSVVVFRAGAWHYPYVIFPVLLWAALRFRQVGAAIASFVVGAVGTWGAVVGSVPVGATSATERVQIAQALFALVAVSLLVVGATLAEREAGSTALARTAGMLGEAQALAHIGSWEWDIRRDRVSWSDELYRVFGVTPGGEPVTYATYLERVHAEDRAAVDAAVERAHRDGLPFAFDHRIVRPDGGERTVWSRGQVVMEGGEAVAMVGTAQDVTEQRQAERLREDILATVSHELRTPLTALLGFAVTLEQRRNDLPEPTIERLVSGLGDAARRLERLLVDLLDVERLRRGILHASRAPTDVRGVAERVVARCDPEGRRVSVSGDPTAADVDGPKVERILENLVANALKHTPADASVEVRLEPLGNDLLIVVEDDGPGIPDEFKERVFDAFDRGSKAFSISPGTGIGLSIVASFAAVHGGRSWVADRDGGGAAFHVLLPDCLVATPLDREPV